MTKYNHRVGNVERPSSHFGTRVVSLGIGAFVGFYMGSMVVVGQIQAAVQPIVTQDSGNVLPIVHALQRNGSLYVVSTVSSSDDLQPASGYNVIQRTEGVQP